jgi:hypothetical protein
MNSKILALDEVLDDAGSFETRVRDRDLEGQYDSH